MKEALEAGIVIGSYIEDKKAYYVKTLDGSQVFIVPEYTIQFINKNKADLQK
jgi:hypothetical protein